MINLLLLTNSRRDNTGDYLKKKKAEKALIQMKKKDVKPTLIEEKSPSFSYSMRKKNLFGKEKTKEISEQKYNKLAARYTKRGGQSESGLGYMTARKADESKKSLTNPTAEYAKNKRGSKQVIKTDQQIVERNRNIKREIQQRLKNTNSIPIKRKSVKKNPYKK